VDISAQAPTYDFQVTGTRIGAALIDYVIVSALLIVGSMGLGFDPGLNVFLLVFVGVTLGYYTLMEGFVGATFGKLFLGLQVVALDGSPCGIEKAAIRNVLRLVDGAFAYLPGIVCIIFTEKRQRIGDLAAGTVVVRMRI